jgi:uncharacterized repeat protein (TIGR03803 family)
MKISDLGRCALGVCAAAMLADCGGGTQLNPSPAGPSTALRVTTADRTRARPAYSVLYSFGAGSGDGTLPAAGLININGTLYGTTSEGGGHCRRGGCGTVFAMTTSGTETLLHSFKGRPDGDGSRPHAGLTDVNGTLYGTTYGGGERKEGTVFSIAPSAKETVLHSFGGESDGAYPFAGLIYVKGMLYGTTQSGGSGSCARSGFSGCGTVFSITTSGTETVLYSFKGGSGDGEEPLADLINLNGMLYGTTYEGGANRCGSSGQRCGTVFTITPSGTESVLHSFGAGTDGAEPEAGLVSVNGTLYGATSKGGVDCRHGGCGTVFAITTSGTESVLHNFGAGTDGIAPDTGLLNVSGTLYGTTRSGGKNDLGTVFSIGTDGKGETVLHSFAGGSGDGEFPFAGLIDVGGKLYGTTAYGGKYLSEGTVYSVSP